MGRLTLEVRNGILPVMEATSAEGRETLKVGIAFCRGGEGIAKKVPTDLHPFIHSLVLTCLTWKF